MAAAAAVGAVPVQRRKEPLDRLRESEASPGSQGYAGPSHPDDAQRSRMTPANIAAKVSERGSGTVGENTIRQTKEE